MHEQPTNEASRSLLAIAQRITEVYAAQLTAQAIMVTGSVAEGISDFYSDLDIILYYDTLPSEEQLLAALEQNQGQKRTLLGERSDDAVIETYMVQGVECQLAHTTIAAWERDMATVLEQLDVTTPLQKALSGMLEAIPLHGEPLILDWQEQLAHYPDALAEAMVRHYLTFFPLWGLQGRLATRDATIWVQQLLVETADNLLGVLAGLNRRYYSSFQFKRTRRFLAQLPLAPAQCADRLESLFHMDMPAAAEEAKALVRETVLLVEQQMPQIEVTRVQKWLDWQEQPWTP